MNTTDAPHIEFGIDSFGDRPRDDRGAILSHARAIRAAVAEAVLADQAGNDVVALGEHHRPEYAISSPETVLAGIATSTRRIRLEPGNPAFGANVDADRLRVLTDAAAPEKLVEPS
ncbi:MULTISPECIES: LLM class flavin-dependent oxidoreductase [Streptomyces]|uniref:LLM class flavin-dependent oxidoreductase n=1 Tax=Streptomyces TaxID=1883 RepID=UPI001F3B271B|nr:MULTISPECIES: LLM class flavin-dependent oxidoreductase [unclassified Streptomyces]MCU4745281.1 LLM class flavin-dependent oxidoreductase [Streptomyces sp. G-5]